MSKQAHVLQSSGKGKQRRPSRRQWIITFIILIGIAGLVFFVLSSRGVIHLSTILSFVKDAIAAVWTFFVAVWQFILVLLANQSFVGFLTLIATLVATTPLIPTIRKLLGKRGTSQTAQPPNPSRSAGNTSVVSKALKTLTTIKIPPIDIRIPRTPQPKTYEFTTDTRLRHDSDLHSREWACKRILDMIPLHGSIAIVGGKKMGKTLLLKYISGVIKKKFSSITYIVEINAAQQTCTTVSGFIRYIVRTLNREDFLQSNPGTPDLLILQKVLTHLKPTRKIPVLCIDDLDDFDPAQFTTEFFKALKGLVEEELLILVATSTKDMLAIDGHLNFFTYPVVELDPFTQAEANPFIQRKMKEIEDTDKTTFTEDEQTLWLKCTSQRLSKRGKVIWHPLRMQIGGQILYQDKIRSIADPHYPHRPGARGYKKRFCERVEERYNQLL